jgi:circadian clock protein KaiB
MKKSSQQEKPEGGQAGGEKYVLRLFVAGDEPNSKKALTNLTTLCKNHLDGRYVIMIVDVLKDYQTALDNNVLVIPALQLVEPAPQVMILGNLSEEGKVLSSLRLTGEQ